MAVRNGFDPTQCACAHDMSNRLIGLRDSTWAFIAALVNKLAPLAFDWRSRNFEIAISPLLYKLLKTRAGKNLRFLKKVFRFLRFLGFNVYAQSHAEHWTQEYDQVKCYTRRLTHSLLC